MNDGKLPEQGSDTTQCMNEKPFRWRSQNPQTRGQEERGIRRPGLTPRWAGSWLNGSLRVEEPAQRRPPPTAGRGCQEARPPAGGKGQETRAARRQKYLVPQPVGPRPRALTPPPRPRRPPPPAIPSAPALKALTPALFCFLRRSRPRILKKVQSLVQIGNG